MDTFDLSVDIDFDHESGDEENDDDDDDEDDDESKKKKKNKKEMQTQKNDRKDVEKNDDKSESKNSSNDEEDFEGFGDDEHKSENQEQVVLPLQGGLAGLITNLSGVNYSNREYSEFDPKKNEILNAKFSFRLCFV